MKLINRYTFSARYIPGLISILPATLIYFFLTKRYSGFDLNEYFETATFLFGISATFVLTFFISMVVREFGSTLEKTYFKNKLGFPTNYLMLYQNDKLPKQSKDRYGEKILTDFRLRRLNEYEEYSNANEAVIILNHASKLISTKYQRHDQVKDANIAYGFARNVSGGLILSIPFSIVGIVIGILLKEYALLFWSIISIIIFSLLLVYRKHWIIRNAERYAEKLISVYLADK